MKQYQFNNMVEPKIDNKEHASGSHYQLNHNTNYLKTS